MKTLTKTLFAVATIAALNANAKISVDDTNSTSFDIAGKIDSQCKVSSNAGGDRSTSLNLASAEAQTTASISLWCNTGQSTAKTTYESRNGGYMVHKDGHRIAYAVDITGTASDMRLTSSRTVDQLTGTGVDGSVSTRAVKVKPLITGLEYAGTYTDTIEVTVSYQ